MDDNKLPDLKYFTGTEHWYKHPLFPNLLYTDGTRYVAENAGAYWLIEKIFSLQHRKEISAKPFQVWTLNVTDDSTATLRVEDGNGNHLYSEHLTYTDFPATGITLWLTDNVLLLPSEY
ncbi:MAG: hypothetical protein HC808_05445 [Candidatus Competibacteraceae bacterium]|nr:hypothetical protein [Candidatus Competibacteraceae bacterium]